ncbi:hypothetical protein H8S33_08540 [Ornithinibacillus sp. BX22]|uniref:Uncharacterized protein n=1 Tax=Ornithinibacillus hominis TaxID=2763055 RepID=A0A923RK16_9BACI|nr:hypothetical protein [Ornithinibacillus hominis]
MLTDKWFIHGLVSFLLAHIIYIFAFWYGYSFSIAMDLLIVGCALLFLALIVFYILFQSVKQVGRWNLVVAVAMYMTIISTCLD